jgi:hypothetical protein
MTMRPIIMTERELLIAARDLLADPSRWIKGEIAQNAAGDARNPDDPDACKWCMNGALIHCAGSGEWWSEERQEPTTLGIALDCLSRITGNNLPVSAWQDREQTTHQEMLELFGKAIEGHSRPDTLSEEYKYWEEWIRRNDPKNMTLWQRLQRARRLMWSRLMIWTGIWVVRR